jgi:predicted ATPase/DNA-binding winged helix-turn-helix (wHTH) protein
VRRRGTTDPATCYLRVFDATVPGVKRPPTQVIYQSGQLEVDVAQRQLRVRGEAVPIGSRAFEIVEALAEAAGELVTKNDLMQRVWPGAVTEESTLWVHLSAVRKALGPERGVLKTVSGRGYQLVGTWQIVRETVDSDQRGSRPVDTAAAPDSAISLPVAGTSLIGREEALLQLQDRLSAHRVVTLTGPGGIGKSRLAFEAARRVLVQGQSDVRLVELASLSNSDLVPSAVATSLGLRSGMRDLSAEAVARAIGHRPLLLLLDNCEHVVGAAARMAETVVQLCPRATMLATSREVLRIDGEYVYNVPPLDVPDERAEPGDILAASAVQLFVARLAAINSAFSPDRVALPEAASICQRLDGIPLAIEFAAARAATLGVSEVNAHLDDRFNLLTSGRRTALPRHRTLRATLDWSYEILSPREQELLCALSIFRGPFTLDGVSAVAAASPSGSADVIDVIHGLVAKSLVTVDLSGSTAPLRLLDSTRAYALEKLDSSGERERIARRHAAYYLALLKRAEIEVAARPPADWLSDYASQIDNVRAALDWAFSTAGDRSLAVALTTASVPLWLRLSLLQECSSRGQQALRTLKTAGTSDLREEMRLHAALGASLYASSEAVDAFTTALELAKTLDDTEYQLRALRGLYIYNTGANHFRAAYSLAQSFHSLAMTGTSQSDRLVGERMLGSAKFYMSDLVGARRHLEQVLALYSATEASRPARRFEDLLRFQFDTRVEARVFLTRVLWLQGFSNQAIQMAEKSLADARAIGHIGSQCLALALASCSIAFSTGDLSAAAAYTELLVDLSTRHSLTHWTHYGTRYRKIIALKSVNAGASSQLSDGSIEELGQSDASLRPLTALTAYVEALAGAGRKNEGLAVLNDSAAHSSESGCYEPELLRLRGELLLLQATDTKPSEDLLRQALDLAHEHGALSWELRAATSLARLLKTQGHPSNAIACLEPVYRRFTEGFDTSDLIAAKRLLDELDDRGPR